MYRLRNPSFASEEVDRLKARADKVRKQFEDEFAGAGGRFKDPQPLLRRFIDAVDAMLANGRSLSSGVYEAHNELCVASQLLADSAPRYILLEYEPSLTGSAQSIDFRATTADGVTRYVDVKTINPQPIDRWDQFRGTRENGRFPENVQVLLDKERHGGELWHGMYAARSRMLEHALGLEKKIRECNVAAADRTFFVLCFCGEGSYWEDDDLEDFVAFYRTDEHRGDDPFSKAEAKYIEDKRINFDRTITHFAYMHRPQDEVRHQSLKWDVQPPLNPFLGS